MSMHEIEVTGNPAVDTATAEIAVALRDAGRSERDAYAEAMRLRDEIMAGVQLDRDELFFWENAGYSRKPEEETEFQGRMRCARELAAAWQAMQADPGLYVSWDGDNDDCALSEGYTGPVWQAALWQAGPGGSFEDGEILASAGSVECEDGADLMRVVEAQLALEAGLKAKADAGGILLTADQVMSWAGLNRYLTEDETERLADCIPNSSIPEAIGTIATDALELPAGCSECGALLVSEDEQDAALCGQHLREADDEEEGIRYRDEEINPG